MLWKVCSAGLILSGFCMFGLAVCVRFAGPVKPALVVAERDFAAGQCAPGQEMDVTFQLQNNSGHPIHVLGLVVC
jgi:hypothetical protein